MNIYVGGGKKGEATEGDTVVVKEDMAVVKENMEVAGEDAEVTDNKNLAAVSK